MSGILSHAANGISGCMADRISDQMRAKLLAGSYRPGSTLSDAQIALHFKCSRIPARDALRRMEAEGYLKRQGRSLIVPDSALPLTEELFVARAALEGELASFAALRITEDELANMQAAQQRLHAQAHEDGDIDQFLRELLHIEQMMFSASGMYLMASEAQRWQTRTRDLVRQVLILPNVRKDISAQQRHLISALSAHDQIWARQMVSVLLRAMFQGFHRGREGHSRSGKVAE